MNDVSTVTNPWKQFVRWVGPFGALLWVALTVALIVSVESLGGAPLGTAGRTGAAFVTALLTLAVVGIHRVLARRGSARQQAQKEPS